MHASVLAGQFRRAARTVQDMWPRPTAQTTFQQVLQYYYYRGTVHAGCHQWSAAVRCFWTCLSVPADYAPPTAIASFKKLVLVQCLLMCNDLETDRVTAPLALPEVTPTAVSRLVNSARSAPSNPTPAGEMSFSAGLKSEQQIQDNSLTVYIQFVRAFVTVDRAAFLTLFLENKDTVLKADGTLDLVCACQVALMRRHLYQVAALYSRISVERLLGLLQLPDEQALISLLGQVSEHDDALWEIEIARDAGEAVVVFPPRPAPPFNESPSFELIQLTRMIRDLDVAVASSSKYTTFLRKSDSDRGPPRGVDDI
jgi:hypothetical protein